MPINLNITFENAAIPPTLLLADDRMRSGTNLKCNTLQYRWIKNLLTWNRRRKNGKKCGGFGWHPRLGLLAFNRSCRSLEIDDGNHNCSIPTTAQVDSTMKRVQNRHDAWWAGGKSQNHVYWVLRVCSHLYNAVHCRWQPLTAVFVWLVQNLKIIVHLSFFKLLFTLPLNHQHFLTQNQPDKLQSNIHDR